MEGSVVIGDRLHTEMVYPTAHITHPSTNPEVHSRELNWQPVDHESDALTTTLPSHLFQTRQRLFTVASCRDPSAADFNRHADFFSLLTNISRNFFGIAAS